MPISVTLRITRAAMTAGRIRRADVRTGLLNVTPPVKEAWCCRLVCGFQYADDMSGEPVLGTQSIPTAVASIAAVRGTDPVRAPLARRHRATSASRASGPPPTMAIIRNAHENRAAGSPPLAMG